MDSFDFDNVKAEKAKALRRYNRFRRIGRFFRAAEVCVAILFILWTFTRLPFAVQISREFLRRISGVISTPLFVFLLGNCIVVALLTRSSSVEENRGSSAANAETEIYEALVRSKPYDEEEEELADHQEIVYDDKEVIVDTTHDSNIKNDDVEIDLDTSCVSDEPNKVYGRSKSDVCGKQSSADHMVVIPTPSSLHRSQTEKCIRIIHHHNNNNSWEINNYAEDNLSNEEFQKTIEAFIAKQLMFRRQESLAVVVHNNKP